MWQKKEGKRALKYKGTYTRDAKNERVFVLIGIRKNGTVHAITFESASMAKKVGWKRV